MSFYGMNKLFVLIFSGILTVSISACSGFQFLTASYKSTDSFINSENNKNVKYKGDNKEYANQVGLMLPKLIDTVEDKLGIKFTKMPIIYICDTWQCMEDFTGANYQPRASANKRGVFISPKLIGKVKVTKNVLTHEITHVLSVENIHSLFQSIPPAWFDEGLATFVSNGGGAEKVTDGQAIESINQGKHFIPNSDGKKFSRMYGDKWGLEPHMFYRQSMMLVKHIHNKNPEKFKIFVRQVFSGNYKFSEVFYKHYNATVLEVWGDYKNELQKT